MLYNHKIGKSCQIRDKAVRELYSTAEAMLVKLIIESREIRPLAYVCSRFINLYQRLSSLINKFTK